MMMVCSQAQTHAHKMEHQICTDFSLLLKSVLAERFLEQVEMKRENLFKPSDHPVLAAASRGDINEMKNILRQVRTP